MLSLEKDNLNFLIKDTLAQSNVNNYSAISKHATNIIDASRSISRKSYLNEFSPTSNIAKNNVTLPLEAKKPQAKEKKSNHNQNFFSKVGVDLLKQTKIVKQFIVPNNQTSLDHLIEHNKRKNLLRESNLLEKEKNEFDRQNIFAPPNRNRNSSKRPSSIKLNKNMKARDLEKFSHLPPNLNLSGINLNSSNLNEKNILSLFQNKYHSVSKIKKENINETRNLNLSNILKENISINNSNVASPYYNYASFDFNTNSSQNQNEKIFGKIHSNVNSNINSNINTNVNSNINSNINSNYINNSNSQILPENVYVNFNNNISPNFNINDISSIGSGKNLNNFLNDFSKKSSFSNHLKMFEINLELDDAVNNYNNSNLYDNYYLNSHIKTVNKNHLFTHLRKYFQIVKKEFNTNRISNICSETLKTFEFDFFLDENINLLYEKLIKLQMIVFAILLVFFKNLSLDDFLKVHIRKLCSCLIYPMINFFECFVINQPQITNDYSISSTMSPNFKEKYKKIYKFNRMNRYFSTKDNIFFLNKFTDELVVLIKQFPSGMLKFTPLRPFYSIILQFTKSIDKHNSSYFSNILINHILYSTLWEEKKQAALYNLLLQNISDFIPKVNKIEEPFLPVMKKKYQYTLVLDLDETLIHYFITPLSKIFFIRPYVFEFLIELQEFYEIVIFTAGTKEYADYILDILDEEVGCLNHRLYRNHTSVVGGYIIKDLTKLGRDLSKVIIIDNIAENFRFQPNNGLHIKTWINDINDTQLLELKNILRDVYLFGVGDVRDIVKNVNEDVGRLKNKSYDKIDISKYMN